MSNRGHIKMRKYRKSNSAWLVGMMRIKIGFFRSIPGLSLIIGSILFDLWLSRPLFIPMYPWENFRLFNLGLA